jgi:uncharacterized protein (DUF3820 family)
MSLVDISPMPQKGKYKGFRMENVPYWYLLWLNDQPFVLPEVKKYIDNNMDVLLVEQKRNSRNN